MFSFSVEVTGFAEIGLLTVGKLKFTEKSS
jgi:hypothetical protein